MPFLPTPAMVTPRSSQAMPGPLTARGVEDINAHDLTSSQLFVLKIVSLVAGTISIVSVLQVSYWFIRMKRNFRHDLIMLLMQSDMLKSIWFMIYPAVDLAQGKVLSASPFCQASGFFLTIGVEACDVAVVLIAIHTALYIPRAGSGNGLYPYRRVVFAVYMGVPILLTSLAFSNKPAFVNSGDFCYLPMQPTWTRNALSWIPRYIILFTIIITYGSIYIYVSALTKEFVAISSSRGESRRSLRDRRDQRKKLTSVPPPPRIQRHGLIDTPISSLHEVTDSQKRSSLFSAMAGSMGRRASGASSQLIDVPKKIAQTIKWKFPEVGVILPKGTDGNQSPGDSHFEVRRASGGSTQLVGANTKPAKGVKWRRQSFGFGAYSYSNLDGEFSGPDAGVVLAPGRRHSAPAPFDAREERPLQWPATKGAAASASSLTDGQFLGEPSPSEPGTLGLMSDTTTFPPTTTAQPASAPSVATTNPRSFWSRSGPSSRLNILNMLRMGPQSPNISVSIFLSPSDLEACTGMVQTRENIQRHTLQLFIYPLVYIAVWLIPFVLHIMVQNGAGAPFSLVLASLLSLCIQGAADAVVFALREKPWRRSHEDRVHELRFWSRKRGKRHTSHMVGRTREEMLVDGRLARRRLNEEIEQRLSERFSERHEARAMIERIDSSEA